MNNIETMKNRLGFTTLTLSAVYLLVYAYLFAVYIVPLLNVPIGQFFDGWTAWTYLYVIGMLSIGLVVFVYAIAVLVMSIVLITQKWGTE